MSLNRAGFPTPQKRDQSLLIEFFRHHGVWAPGVKLFRRLQFKSKAAIISAVFLLPLVLVSVALWQAKQEVIEFAEKERLGIAVYSPLGEFYGSLTRVRNATRAMLGGHDAKADYEAGRVSADKALADFDKRLTESGDPLRLREHFDKVRGAWNNTAAASNGVDDKGRTVFGPVMEATRELLNHLGDDSNLVLDPDVDSFYLINAMVLSLPKVIEDAGQTWGWGTYATAKGQLDRSQTAQFNVWLARTGSGIKDLHDYIGRAQVVSPQLKTKIDLSELARVDAFAAKVRAVVIDGKAASAPEIYVAGREALQSLDKLYQTILPSIDELLATRIRVQRQQRAMLAGAVLAFVAIGLYFFYSFFLVTQGGLREVQKHLEAMTAGDLTTHPQPWGQDEAARLMGTLADMQGSLRKIVSQVRGSSERIVHASSEIASASMDLSARTEQTASSLEQSAASMEEISSTIQNTAGNAQQAAAVAAANSGVAARGGDVIGQVVSTMQEIHASSSKISDIIGVIDGIAFQTNILALNAAVEAARAGEQGRGFAVVASEVRSLAQRSAQAAKEIKALITNSVERVDSGSRVVAGAGNTMRELVGNAQRMNELLSEISIAAKQESAGLSQVGSAVQDLDRMTQQNAALVEQTAAAASSLQSQAIDLASQVAKFRLP
jgi:methyl-accepting chemotaxis protein